MIRTFDNSILLNLMDFLGSQRKEKSITVNYEMLEGDRFWYDDLPPYVRLQAVSTTDYKMYSSRGKRYLCSVDFINNRVRVEKVY